MTLDPDVNDRKFELRAGPYGSHYRHLTGPVGVGLLFPNNLPTIIDNAAMLEQPARDQHAVMGCSQRNARHYDPCNYPVARVYSANVNKMETAD
jgi:hypothetical protein